jgi:hypothetical protein
VYCCLGAVSSCCIQGLLPWGVLLQGAWGVLQLTPNQSPDHAYAAAPRRPAALCCHSMQRRSHPCWNLVG